MKPTIRRLSTRLVGLGALALVACAPAIVTQPAVTNSAVPGENRAAVPSPPEDPKPSVVWPLTGLSAVDAPESDVARMAIAVKIDNSGEAHPQAGPESADIVFEEYMARRGWTRLVAVFQSTWPEVVGNVRSMRPMDPYIVGSLYAPLTFSGAAPGPLRDALALSDQIYLAEDLRNCRPAFYQKSGTRRPYSTYVHLDEVASCAGAAAAQPAPHQFDYAYPADHATASLTGTPVSAIDVKFSRAAHPYWTWDAASGRFMRFEAAGPHLTQSGAQVGATNLVILRASVRYKYGDDPETLLAGTVGGTGYIATGGKYVEIRWSKADRRDAFHLTTLDGTPVYLAPGNTWVELLPSSGTRESQVLSFDDYVITTGP